MDILPQLIVSGLAAGSLYALMAIGLILIFRTTDIVNFAHGDMAMFSTFVAYVLITAYGVPFWAGLLAAVVVGFLLGAFMDQVVLRPARRASVISLLIATLGVALILESVAGWLWGWDTKPFPKAIRGAPIILGDVVLSRHSLLAFVVAISCAAGLFVLLKFTKMGTAMRAVAQNRLAAQLLGVPVERISMLSWGIGAAMGAVAGIFIAPTVFLAPAVMVKVMLKAFAAAVLGGFTSLPGAVLGGLLLGIFDNLVGGYVSTQLKETLVFALIIVVLAVRPHGLLGEPLQRRPV
jgi:branched-chain amino acid transport system permease protein